RGFGASGRHRARAAPGSEAALSHDRAAAGDVASGPRGGRARSRRGATAVCGRRALRGRGVRRATACGRSWRTRTGGTREDPVADVMKRGGGECPDPETIAAHLDGRLSGRERALVTEHLAACEDCYTVFTESAQTHGVAEPARMRRAERWRAWVTVPRLAWSSAGAALATAACVWLLVASGGIMPSRQPNQELQAMAEALFSDRVIEGRLTGGFAYAHLRGPIRS